MQRQYNEVADEIENLKKIITQVAGFQAEQDNVKERLNTRYSDRNLGYTAETKSPWWWPFR